jgi:hypothetical protein
MDWNEFFKQDRRKNILTAIFLVSTFISAFISVTICDNSSSWLCSVITLFSIPFRLEGVGAYVILPFLFLFYFISCLIVWVYDKVKKK